MSHEIEIAHIKKEYPDGTVALRDVSLVFPRSKTTALVGPSGSGKSTVLKIIAGLIEPTSGRVTFEGRNVTDLPPERRNIGMVFQSYALFPNMTVAENVEFGLKVRHVEAAKRRKLVEEVLATVQIDQLAHRRIHQLSGGQQQRVALARALVIKPDILLLDEPLSALDAKIRYELRAELARLLQQFKITAVYVTHDQQEAMSLGDQVVVMDKGAIIQAGPPHEVYARPANEFVANFIGSANLFPVIVEAQGAGVVLRLPFCVLSLPEQDFRQRWPHLKPGPARLLCRPQDIVIDSGGGHTSISVTDILYLGDRVRISGMTPDGHLIAVEAHNSTRVEPNGTIPVRINESYIHIIQQ
jgi:putative spermidine/putrescine transport system ATP-binding protein